MATLKKLPLPAWVHMHFKRLQYGNLPQEHALLVEDATLPVYSDGWYFDRKAKKSWYCVGGKAYAYTNESCDHTEIFKFDLNVASARIMRDEEAAALETLIKNGFPLPKEVRDQYDTFRQWQEGNSYASRGYHRLKKDVAAMTRRLQAFKASLVNRPTP